MTESLESSLATGRRRARWAMATLCALAASQLLMAFVWRDAMPILRYAAGSPVATLAARVAATRLLARAVGIYVLAIAAAAVCFLRWLHRAVANARRLAPSLDLTPGDAVASCLIPVLNLVAVPGTMRTLDRAVDPTAVVAPLCVEASPHYRVPAAWRDDAPTLRPAPVITWWLVYLGSCVPLLVARVRTPVERTSWIFASLVVAAAASMCALAVVFAIDARTTERARRQAALDAARLP